MPILGLKFSRVPIIFEMKFKVLKTLHHLTSDFTVSASPTLSYFKFFQLLYSDLLSECALGFTQSLSYFPVCLSSSPSFYLTIFYQVFGAKLGVNFSMDFPLPLLFLSWDRCLVHNFINLVHNSINSYFSLSRNYIEGREHVLFISEFPTFSIIYSTQWDFLGGLTGKESTCNVGDSGLIPRLGSSSGKG